MADTSLTPTPGQTAGPFFHFGLIYPKSHEIVDASVLSAIRFHGTVRDAEGAPVPDALIELWHARPDGTVVDSPGHIRRDGAFSGFGRAATDPEGRYWFRTLEPGATPDGGPPFYAVAVFARGLLHRLFTRAYLPGDNLARSPLLTSLEPTARDTLVARREADGSLRFDITLGGEGETTFLDFDVPQGTDDA
jgi:protocatechuate 3,4-dioxygenase alpha subunit